MSTRKGYFWIDCIAVAMLIVINFFSYSFLNIYNRMILHANIWTFIVLLVFFFNHINIINAVKNRDKELLLLVAAGVIVVLNMFLSHSGPAVLFDIANLLLILYLADKVILADQLIYSLGIMGICVLVSWLGKDGRGYNTNTASYIVTMMAIITGLGFVLFFQKKGKAVIGKIISFLLVLLIALPMILKMHCRGALIGVICFIILAYLVPGKLWNCQKLFGFMFKVLIGIGIIFPMVYVWLSYNYTGERISFMSKGIFSGRERVWSQFITAFLNEPITGIGNDFAAKIPDLYYAEVHNGFLHILVVYGLILFIIIFYLINKKVMQVIKLELTPVGIYCLSALISMLIISILETFFAVSFFNQLFFIFLILCRYGTEKWKEIEDNV